jgi:Epoxide hydrolase N terminus
VSSTAQTATEVRPFTVSTSEDELAELRRRIAATRWPDRETDASQGVQLDTIQALAAYWATDYDWRKFEERFAALPHFITEIDGVDIHFIQRALRA